MDAPAYILNETVKSSLNFKTEMKMNEILRMMKKLTYLVCLGASCLLTFVLPLSAQTERPNIILFLTDDLGFGDLSLTDHPYVKTPNIDRMAKGGTFFENFYVSSPVCSPTRASFQTGQFPARQSVHSAFPGKQVQADKYKMPVFLDPNVPQVSRALQENGYKTAHFGKWHLSASPKHFNNEIPNPSHYGFDDFKTYHTYFSDVNRKHHFTRALDKKKYPDRDKKHYRAYSSEFIVDEVLAFMKNHPGNPVYINAWTLVPHAKLIPIAEELAVYADLEPDPNDFPLYMRDYLKAIPPEELKERMQIYCAAVTGLDKAVGKLLDGLKEMGKEKETFVFFTSDNGPEDVYGGTVNSGTGSPGPLRGRKRSIYEGGVKTGAIAYWPGTVPAGRVDDTSVLSSVDWLPTVAALSGTKLPELSCDGEDISDILEGKKRSRKTDLFWEWRFGVRGPDKYTPPQLAMRQGDWKFFMNPDGSRVELYNLVQDPSEKENVASENPEIVAKLKPLLEEWKASLPVEAPVSKYVHNADAPPFSYENR